MVRRFISLFLAALLVLLMAQPQTAAPDPKAEKQARFVEKVKAGVAKLGVGPDARIKVKLKNKTQVAGYISEVGETHFTVTDLKTAQPTVVAYPEVTQIQGNNLSTKAKIIIAASIIAGVIIVLVIIKGALCDGC